MDFTIGDEIDQLFGCVRLKLSPSPVLMKICILKQLAGVDLDLIRADPFIIPKTHEILPVRFQGGAK